MAEQKIHYVSLGCPKNRVDSEVMLGMASEEGYTVVPHPEEADVLVVNTCSFIDAARRESVDAILEMADIKQAYPGKKLVVTGCLPQRYPEELAKELPEVDHFVGTGQIPSFRNVLHNEDAPRDLASEAPGWLYSHQSPRLQSTPFYTSYVKIAEGCDRTCAFCAIPSFRGKQKSRTISSIVAEVQDLATRGVKEINLIAQELNGYGRDLPKGPSKTRIVLADLLQALEEVEPGPQWIRLLYMYPHGFDERLVTQIAQSTRVVPYIDMPLQHVSDAVLRRMRRAGNGQDIRNLLASLRSAIPQLTVRTTFLVGFPGETEDDFQQLKEFIIEQEFDRVGIFAFSPEEGTSSFELPDPVDPDVAEARRKELYEIQEAISEKKLARFLDKELQVLVEGVSDESDLLLQGRFAGQAPDIDGVVYINDGEAKKGDMVTVRIEQTGQHDLVGGIVSTSTPS
jgi:ribosomal protein S12 methylthiotransferase